MRRGFSLRGRLTVSMLLVFALGLAAAATLFYVEVGSARADLRDRTLRSQARDLLAEPARRARRAPRAAPVRVLGRRLRPAALRVLLHPLRLGRTAGRVLARPRGTPAAARGPAGRDLRPARLHRRRTRPAGARRRAGPGRAHRRRRSRPARPGDAGRERAARRGLRVPLRARTLRAALAGPDLADQRLEPAPGRPRLARGGRGRAGEPGGAHHRRPAAGRDSGRWRRRSTPRSTAWPAPMWRSGG